MPTQEEILTAVAAKTEQIAIAVNDLTNLIVSLSPDKSGEQAPQAGPTPQADATTKLVEGFITSQKEFNERIKGKFFDYLDEAMRVSNERRKSRDDAKSS